jgi:very-short-patch-repair endonuclease
MSKFRTGTKHPQIKKWSEDSRNNQSVRLKGILAGEKNPAKRLSVRRKISKTMKKLAKTSSYINPMQGKTHSMESLKKIFSKRSMTAPEKKIANLLESKKIKYHTQFFISNCGTVFSYDFKIQKRPIIIEVDGDYWHGGPGVEKYWFGVNKTRETDIKKDELAKSRGYKVLRLWESDINTSPENCLKQIEELL